MDTTAKKSGYDSSTIQKESKRRFFSEYKSDLRTAYDVGYAKGWDHAYDIPKRMGSKSAAACGYKKGMRNRYRTDQYIKQYQKQGKNY